MDCAKRFVFAALFILVFSVVFFSPVNADACSNAVTQFNAAYVHYLDLVQAKGGSDPATLAARSAYVQASNQRDAACGITKTTRCGDGVCEGTEDMALCPEDCGAVTSTPWPTPPEGGEKGDGKSGVVCGNGECERSDGENEETCAIDCAAPEAEYRFTLESVFSERKRFYANGKGQAQLEFHAQEKKVGAGAGGAGGVAEWVDAPGLSVDFVLRRNSGGMSGVELGALSKQNAVTDGRGRATLAYTTPFIFARSGAFVGSGFISASVQASAAKDGKSLGRADYSFELHPPIYIEKLAAEPIEVDENGKGGAYFRVKDSLRQEKTASFTTRLAEVSFDLTGPFTAVGGKKSVEEKFDLYVQPLAGIRSINLEDVTEWSGIYANMKKSVLTDSLVIGGNSVFKRIPNVGAPLEKLAGANTLKIGVLTPGNYVSGYLAVQNARQAGTSIGEARTGTEAALYGATIALEGLSFGLGVITGNLKMDEGAKNGADLLASTTINLLKEEIIATAKAHRVANAKLVYYPRVIRVSVSDVDGYNVTGWVPFFIRRYE